MLAHERKPESEASRDPLDLSARLSRTDHDWDVALSEQQQRIRGTCEGVARGVGENPVNIGKDDE
jgi:hypothetical protein